jgi:hypothetical protein
MNQDDDVERLFSWLQTPEIRYREFAGAREVTDAVVSLQARTNTAAINPPAPHHVQLDEEYPQDQFPDQSQVVVEVEPLVRGPAIVAPTPTPVARTIEAGPFALGAGGRGVAQSPEDVVAPPPVAPPPSIAQAAPGVPPAPPQPVPATGGGLLGGAYRETGEERMAPVAPPAPPPPGNHDEHTGRSLDSVFNRLSGGRPSQPDPRDRMRHIPGLGPTTGRPR